MAKVYITRIIPEAGIKMLKEKGYEVVVNPDDRVLTKEELITALKDQNYDALFCLLTDKIDGEVMDAFGPQLKVVANMAVGFDNIDTQKAKKRGIMITNTPGVLTDTVAEHTFTLMLSIAHRIVEADKFMRAGKYIGWAPMLMLGNDLSGKTLGVVGLGRIGSRVAHHAVKGFEMKVLYYDVNRNEEFEKEFGAVYVSLDDLLKQSDFVSIHVPLLPITQHLINAEKLKLMKPTSYLINTSRGPIIDESALAMALANKTIKGAALDVFEFEPKITPELLPLDNVILTPHIASATEETRSKMSVLAAENIIEALEGRTSPNLLQN
ncbi:D-glycerate dehydrogenase [Candidatus Azambacteria bacterium RIFCSPHIGHO2_01_FULL_40_24]|uniref:D-glycerate dehydrogenase n=1 Tax=Candidatus Azambacteria bacterium RIFCSPHIGHO2_01_FULL_40_24 TaxID=1797301 RepID=A0A1F5B2U2_9BACT|nr:MAG: D-glycerate dehydrogenase [Candidatus Azambacteria bacterium RIFCSPHIGHO2_01_FULL_40_24]